uniref:Forkhead box protein M1 n=2 Tax=Anolis carolinensis TaxID=28377 RepID=A0A803T1D9_ANOCA|nr:PREDICTED: forkhead box protein M1 isoform X1 [Anolis carolinensis]XP_008109536.1 PREDICTED: forkhead box protein M1 isoform X1 [Anolis carolinensis]XP_008109537.1 PREDICTED: forkhead box protein M1 isoform X1 [Anolis carolinensis]|eukprot:XP_003221447.1 PREDICTED: forkhead box protein M1 isoform X1 [Anolis carolinensis]
MKSSPHRPLILKRRKLSLTPPDSSSTQVRVEPSRESPEQERARSNECNSNRPETVPQSVLTGIKIIDHPTMSNTQVVSVPASADIQSILEALMTRGKESGDNGPKKFILIGGESHNARTDSGTFQTEDQHIIATRGAQKEHKCSGQSSGTVEESLSEDGQEQDGNGSRETTSSSLNNSLTNIQWLGKMSSSELSPCSMKKGMEKENQTPEHKTIKVEESSAAPSSASSGQESFIERPPYSYMAMIQFAINSTEKNRMMLKDIYTWIENHFPYFKHVAKPGWKNSIRHNLSLHDMFVRETSANGKISFWTIHPEANRYLTLDQVFKPLDAGSPASPELLESQQKRHTVDLQKNLGTSSSCKIEPQAARRKMKPLLPRVNSYLVPIHFPVGQSLIFPPSSKVPIAHSAAEIVKNTKQVHIVPKVPPSMEELTPFSSANFIKEEICPFASDHPTKENSLKPMAIKEENDTFCSQEWVFLPAISVKDEPTQPTEKLNVCLSVPPEEEARQFTALKLPPQNMLDMMPIKRRERHKINKSRRKQHLSLPCSEEPGILLPSSGSSDSFTHDFPLGQGNVSQLGCFQGEDGSCKTPIKEMFNKQPASSTPSKTPVATSPFLALTDPWRPGPFVKESGDLDLCPVRTLPAPLLSLQENADLLGLSSTPSRQFLCDSPQLPLLNAESSAMVSGPLTSSPALSKTSSPELQTSVVSENHSLLEGLVLDTMNDSLSKILLDVSFPGLEDDSLGTELNWSHLISELK